MIQRVTAVLLVLLTVLVVLEARSLRMLRAELQDMKDRVALQAQRVSAREFSGERTEELVKTADWLHAIYRTPEGFSRPTGLCGDAGLDRSALWFLDIYRRERLIGASEEAARAEVLQAIARHKRGS